jgi:hypothetical protein
MSELIHCSSCRRTLQVPDALVGQDVQCPTCGATFVAAIGEKQSGRREADRTIRPRRDWEDDVSAGQGGADPRRWSDYPGLGDGPRLRAHRGVAILVLGILSIVLCGFMGPVAWCLAKSDLAAIRQGRMDPEGEGLTQLGQICGIVGTCRLILLELLCGVITFAGLFAR